MNSLMILRFAAPPRSKFTHHSLMGPLYWNFDNSTIFCKFPWKCVNFQNSLKARYSLKIRDPYWPYIANFGRFWVNFGILEMSENFENSLKDRYSLKNSWPIIIYTTHFGQFWVNFGHEWIFKIHSKFFQTSKFQYWGPEKNSLNIHSLWKIRPTPPKSIVWVNSFRYVP